MSRVATIISIWQQRPAGVRCNEICAHLEYLGFKIRQGSKGNHRILSHAGLPSFLGSNFDCGHGANAIVKPVYIRKLIRLVLEHQEDLDKLWSRE